MIDFAQARRTMVDNQVATSSVTDRQLLAAMRRIPRERFVPDGGARSRLHRPRRAAGAGPGPLGAGARLRGSCSSPRSRPTTRCSMPAAAPATRPRCSPRCRRQTVALETDAGPRRGRARKPRGRRRRQLRSSSPASCRPRPRRRSTWSSLRTSSTPPPPQLLTLLRDGGRLVALIGGQDAPPVAQLFIKAGHVGLAARHFDALQRAPGQPGRRRIRLLVDRIVNCC